MTRNRIERIVDAVLYEGYMLYPYRPSSVKNRQRWNFGVVVPEPYCRSVDPSERAVLKTECLLEGGPDTTVEISVRFLQLVKREIERDDSTSLDPIDLLEECDETIEREIALSPFQPFRTGRLVRRVIDVPAVSERGVAAPGGRTAVRSNEAIRGEVAVRTVDGGDGTVRICVAISNLTPIESPEGLRRDGALRHSLLSAHVVLSAHEGSFVSLLDPDDRFRRAVAECHQDGLYPVLVGEVGDRESVLAAPIILYDHPQVAPESPDNLFDGTEIDEILTLRIQTLSDAEKREIRSGDPRTRQLLERADSLGPAALGRLHGAMRSTPPGGRPQ
jgi:hypothetical protein